MAKVIEVRTGGEIFCSDEQSIFRPCDVIKRITHLGECEDCPMQEFMCRYYEAGNLLREEDLAPLSFISDWFLTDSECHEEI